jgi:hypothetical protein
MPAAHEEAGDLHARGFSFRTFGTSDSCANLGENHHAHGHLLYLLPQGWMLFSQSHLTHLDHAIACHWVDLHPAA